MNNSSGESAAPLAWNLSGTKIGTISNLMQAGETAWVEHNDVVKRYNCWQSIAVLIDNRLLPKHKKRLKDLQKLIRDKAYYKNPHISQYIKGSDEWIQNQCVLNKDNMLIWSNVYIKYVNGLLKYIGMDIKSEDSDIGELE